MKLNIFPINFRTGSILVLTYSFSNEIVQKRAVREQIISKAGDQKLVIPKNRLVQKRSSIDLSCIPGPDGVVDIDVVDAVVDIIFGRLWHPAL